VVRSSGHGAQRVLQPLGQGRRATGAVRVLRSGAQQLLEKYLDEVEASLDHDSDRPITGENRRPTSAFLRSVEEKIKVSDSGKQSFRQEVVRKAMVAFKAGEKFRLGSHARMREAIEQYLFDRAARRAALVTSTARPDDEARQKISVCMSAWSRNTVTTITAQRSLELRHHLTVSGIVRPLTRLRRTREAMSTSEQQRENTGH